jgi:uncharacterized protein
MHRKLVVLDELTHRTAERISQARGRWPCGEGCDVCCRSLPELPHVSKDEWARIAIALDALPHASKLAVDTAFAAPLAGPKVVCPLLDETSGRCRVYDARPVRCRSYGFYADRDAVLGCSAIAETASQDPEIVWGNHTALERELAELGPTRSIAEWVREARGW